MADMNDLDKLRVMLPHWIEHNHGHGHEFKKWAAQLEQVGEAEVASHLENAVKALDAAQKYLEKAMEKVGGPLEGKAGHHHH